MSTRIICPQCGPVNTFSSYWVVAIGSVGSISNGYSICGKCGTILELEAGLPPKKEGAGQ